jgi:Na+/citrate or Na+/malate symporter
MTPAVSTFWIYLAAYISIGGIPALVLGVVARLAGRPFDTPGRFRVFLVLLAIVAFFGVVASALSYNLASMAGVFASFRATTLVWPLISAIVIFVWASGFPLSRVFPRRR